MMVPSLEEEAKVAPPGMEATQRTASVWPKKRVVSFQGVVVVGEEEEESLVQRTMVLSAEPVRSWVGEMDRTDQTVWEWALRTWTCWKVEDQTMAVLGDERESISS